MPKLKLDSHHRKIANALIAFVLGKISLKQYRRKIGKLDAQEPYEVTEETWRRHDGTHFKIIKILNRKTHAVISKKTEEISENIMEAKA